MTDKGSLVASGRTAEIFAWGDDRVLKLIRPAFPPDLADLEAAILRRAHAGGIGCPIAHEIVELEGRRGIVLERLEGPSMLDRLMSEFDRAAFWGATLANLHRGMHAREVDDPPSQRDRLARIIRSGRSLDEDRKAAILRILDSLPDGKSVCHGDFHPGNVILTATGPVVIDWLDATIGDPVGDVARTLLLLELGRPPLGFLTRLRLEAARGGFVRAYAKRYAQQRPIPEEKLRQWRAVVAAARLEEDLRGERRTLVRVLSEVL